MNELATRPEAPTPLATLRTQLEQRAAEFAMVLPSHITPEKLQRTLITAVQGNPELMRCDRRSFLTAAMKCAQDGLLPDGHEAAIVPFNTRQKVEGEWRWLKLAQYMPMVFGLRKKIRQSGEVKDIYAGVVYRQELDAGRFHYEEGAERTLRHRPLYDPDFRPTDADVVLAYSIAVFEDGSQSYEVLRRWEIDEIREASQTGSTTDKQGNPREAKGPWVDWFAEMAKKSVLRRHSKSLPQSSDVFADVEAEDMAHAARSAVALLDSTRPDPPALADERIDRQTGELSPANPPADDGPEDPPTVDAKPKRRGRPPKAKDEPAAPEAPDPPQAPEAPPEAAPEDQSTVEASDNNPPAVAEPEDRLPPPKATTLPADPEPADDGQYDELGITKDPAEALADEYVTRARRCELLIDLRSLEREAEMDLAQMPGHLAACVDTEFDHARRRLTPAREPDLE